jgi:hypothetical protein
MSVKTYSYSKNGNDYLSSHFQVKEFASISNGKVYTDEVLINTDLVSMLEKLYSKLNCTAISVQSGYRCAAHDAAISVSHSGQHPLGNAADIICKNKNGIISSKIVCCVASDLGFNGIANINTNYRSVHLDVRDLNKYSKYYGDEVYGYSSIWNQSGPNGKKYSDFYTYFNLTKSEVEKYTVNTPESTKVSDMISHEVVKTKLKVKSGNWNVRKSDSTKGSVIKVVKGGTILESSNKTSNGWYYIDDCDGYISSSGVEKV